MKKCLNCGKAIVRKYRRRFKDFFNQKYCNRICYFKSRIGKPLSKKTKNKISQRKKGKPLSKIHRKNLSKSHLGKWKGNKNPRWNGGKYKTKAGYIMQKKTYSSFCN